MGNEALIKTTCGSLNLWKLHPNLVIPPVPACRGTEELMRFVRLADKVSKYSLQHSPIFEATGHHLHSGLGHLQQIAESCELKINGFTRESSGTLELSSISETDPPTQPNVWAGYVPALMTTDPTNHLAVALHPTNGPCGPTGPFQLASFTEESQGDIKSTNTWQNMPALAGGVNAMRMSPAGNLLAVATGTGVQIFHFNGANPITKYTSIGTTATTSLRPVAPSCMSLRSLLAARSKRPGHHTQYPPA